MYCVVCPLSYQLKSYLILARSLLKYSPMSMHLVLVELKMYESLSSAS